MDDADNQQPHAASDGGDGSDEGPRYVTTPLDVAMDTQPSERGSEEPPPYVPETVLLRVEDGMSAARVNELIAATDAVVSQEVSAKQISKGFVKLQVTPGFTVEEAVAALDGADDTIAAQPDYLYYALLGNEADLRQRLSRGVGSFGSTKTLPREAASAHDTQALMDDGSAFAKDNQDTSQPDDTEEAQGDRGNRIGRLTRAGERRADSLDIAAHNNSDKTDLSNDVGTDNQDVAQLDDGAVHNGRGEHADEVIASKENPAESYDGTLYDGSDEPYTDVTENDVAPKTDMEAGDSEPYRSEADESSDLQAEELTPSSNKDIADDEQLSLQEALTANDPYAEEQWALSSMRVYEAWAYATCDGSVGVAILDEGPDPSHVDLIDNVRDTYDAHTKKPTSSILVNHGTHVSGIVGATVDNGIGVAGVSHNAALAILNVFYKRNTTSDSSKYVTNTSTLVEAYRHLLDNRGTLGVRVINLSLGVKKNSKSSYSDDALVACIDEAFDKGIVTVAAAGNSDLGAVPYYEYPGDAQNVVSVMNLRKASSDVSISATSNYNVNGQTSKNICAPGTNIRSTSLDDSYEVLSGTSMAAPHVSGVLALEFAANPQLTAREAVDILYATARDLGDEGWDDQYGWGAVDACAAVQMAKEGTHPELPDISDHETPLPTVKGPTCVPVGGHAIFNVKNGSLQIKAGESAATLDDNMLTGVAEGVVTLSVLDNQGVEQASRNVVVYATNGCWTIQAVGNTSYVLDVKGGSVLNSANAQLYTSNGKSNQVWLLEPQNGGSFVMRSGKSGKVLDVSGGSQRAGANVIQYAPSGKAWQRWKLMVNADNTITFVNVNSSMALELAGDPANSVNVRQGEENGQARQHWVLQSVTADIGPIWDGVYKVASSINKSYVLDVQRASTSNGGNVQLYRSNDKDNQRWRFEYLGKGIYKIVNVNSGKVLDVARGTLKNSVNIDQWSWNKGSNQRWELEAHGDGSYGIMRAGTSWAVDVKGAVAENGRNVHQYQSKQNKAQRWYLTQY